MSADRASIGSSVQDLGHDLRAIARAVAQPEDGGRHRVQLNVSLGTHQNHRRAIFLRAPQGNPWCEAYANARSFVFRAPHGSNNMQIACQSASSAPSRYASGTCSRRNGMPRRLQRRYRVLRLIPSRSAVSDMLPSHSRMCRNTSSRTADAGAGCCDAGAAWRMDSLRSSLGRSLSRTTPPSQIANAVRITLRSSRTFPGQS